MKMCALALLLLLLVITTSGQDYPVPERPLNHGPPGPPNKETDLLFKYKTCYNSNNIPRGVGMQSLCTTLVEKLSDPFPTERDFRKACDLLMGPFCINECIRVAALFDAPVINRNPDVSEALTFVYPIGFNNHEKKYTLTLGDCKACMEEYRCFPGPQITA